MEREEKERDKYTENMKIVYEGVESEALKVREMLEKTGADPDSRRELVVLAAQLIRVNEQLIGEKEEESKRHREEELKSKSEDNISKGNKGKGRKREESQQRHSRRTSSCQARLAIPSTSGEED